MGYSRSQSYSESQSQSQSQSFSMSQGNSQNLGDLDFDDMMADLEVPGIPQATDLMDFGGLGEITESYAEKAARWGIEDDGANEGLSDPADLRSISFQRSKGENRRFADEVGFLLEGLKASQPLAVRRSSALQFVENVLDHEFIRKLKVIDGIARSWNFLRQAGAGDGDHVVDGALFLFLALITKDIRNFDPLLPKIDDVVSAATKTLSISHEDDPLIGARVPKSERGLINTLKSLLRKAKIDTEDAAMSTRRLVSTSIKALAALMPTPLSLPILEPVIASLLQEIKTFTERLKSFTAGEPLEQEDADNGSSLVDLTHTDNCLRVLEAFTMRGNRYEHASAAMDIVRGQANELTQQLLSLSLGCQVLMGTANEKKAVTAATCLISALRVPVNLSSSDVFWCRAILSHPITLPGTIRIIIQSEREAAKTSPVGGRESVHDVLCLGLALLTNLVEQVPGARESVREITYNPSCPGKPACTFDCRCPKRISALRCLVELYERKTEEAESCVTDGQAIQGAEAAFVAGHCSVLLGILGLDNAANLKIIVKALPGKHRQEKIDQLLTAVKDFSEVQSGAKQALDTTKTHACEPGDMEEAEDMREREPADTTDDGSEDKSGMIISQIITMLEELRGAA
ncbi:hypothetical protein DACRYDRAFT_23893 [Dacryopinax primogenitus]|uniref:Wings apart-like protein C-terminal domain-containing protein n=1 Tax=Dacryopinax primogenitus (strain DJM 731) TaxID=1858805 RepID=M5G0E7_DACPD|nr:uncharacterized protein DACRYDRAFT_23893 [Dacryopinax primogenitus]EJT99306.1 hypothetical protein DACRYDRAFT_23893 [Dacryopinax primogenitus]